MLTYRTHKKKKDKRLVHWTAESEAAFEKYKTDLTYVALEIRLVTDASDKSMGTALERSSKKGCQLFRFFQRNTLLHI